MVIVMRVVIVGGHFSLSIIVYYLVWPIQLLETKLDTMYIYDHIQAFFKYKPLNVFFLLIPLTMLNILILYRVPISLYNKRQY